MFLVPSEGFEQVKFFPQLHYASSSVGPAPKASTMPEPRPKREVPPLICTHLFNHALGEDSTKNAHDGTNLRAKHNKKL